MCLLCHGSLIPICKLGNQVLAHNFASTFIWFFIGRRADVVMCHKADTRPGLASVTPLMQVTKLSPASMDFWKMARISKALRSAAVGVMAGAVGLSFKA